MKKEMREMLVKKRKVVVIIAAIVAIAAAIICVAFVLASNFFKNHFLRGTTINDLDCSYLDVNEAADKIFEKIASEYIEISFINNRYQMELGKMGLEFNGLEQLEEIQANQLKDLKQNRSYKIENPVKFNPERLKKVLRSIPELKEDNMATAKNAYITVGDDGTLEIVKEVPGTVIDFDEALQLFLENYFYGTKSISFKIITEAEPQVTSTDKTLIEEVESVNKVLDTTITFKLVDGSTYVLDKNVTKHWVTKDENGHYTVDLENIPKFVDSLNERVKTLGTHVMFYPTDLDRPIEVPGDVILEIDQESEIKKIKTQLIEYEDSTREPTYKSFIDENGIQSYVEVDLTRQHVWMYVDGKQIVSTDCVSGDVAKDRETPTGLYYLTYKKRNATLKGYKPNGQLEYATFVKYWMPFNGGVGLHDASWRNKFGGTINQYNGSHGCVNLPSNAAKTIYENIDRTMPIIVYKS